MSSNTNKLILGSDIVNSLYLGSQAVDKLYLGSDLIYKGKEHLVFTGYDKSNQGITGSQTYTGKNKYTTTKTLYLKEIQVVFNGKGSADTGSDDIYVNIEGMGWSYLLNIYPQSDRSGWYMRPRGVSSCDKMPVPSSLTNVWNVYKMTYLKDENKYKYQFNSLQQGNTSPLTDYGVVKGISKMPAVAAGQELYFRFEFTIDSKTGKQFIEKECYALLEDEDGNTVKFALA